MSDLQRRHTGDHERTSSSDRTLEGEHGSSNGQNNKEEEGGGGQEEKGEQGPPLPVGFFDPRLHKTRIEVAWKWVVTSRYQDHAGSTLANCQQH